MPDTFTLRIELGNAAMQYPDDVAAVLRQLADRLSGCVWFSPDSEPIHDVNGNRIGQWSVA